MKRGLQVVLGILSLIPLYFAVTGILLGAGPFGGEGVPGPLDNQLRYVSGVYVLVTLLIWRIVPRIEEEGAILALVTVALAFGGLGRVISMATVGDALPIQALFAALELGAPVLILWQRAVAKRTPWGRDRCATSC